MLAHEEANEICLIILDKIQFKQSTQRRQLKHDDIAISIDQMRMDILTTHPNHLEYMVISILGDLVAEAIADYHSL